MKKAINLDSIKLDVSGVHKLDELHTFVETQPISIFDGMSTMQVITLYILTQKAGFDRFTTWLQTDLEAAQETYKSVKSQNNFGKGGFIKTFEDLAIDPR